MLVGMDTNEYGSPVSTHRCAACGRTYTVCPPYIGDFRGCQEITCASYDVERDVDLMFAIEPWRIIRAEGS